MTLRLAWRGATLRLEAPRSLFSTAYVDPGTRLLLETLPERGPASFLDLGCGYGALGLPVAARFPEARALLADRDLLAVDASRGNAARNSLANVEVLPSLGYEGVPEGRGPFDWVLMNAPARAGERVLELFLAGGVRRLAPAGEMRVVVIAPLASAVEATARGLGLEGMKVAASARHAVFAFAAGRGSAAATWTDPGLDAHLRDQVELELPGLERPLRLERPTDLADEPHRLPLAVPLLAESLPDREPERVLVFRSGYGLLAAVALARYPRARVTACDRDLLAAAFTRRNCARAGARLEVLESIAPASPGATFDLVLGELLPPLGPEGCVAELERVRAALAPGGRALVLGLAKQWRERLKAASGDLGLELRARRGLAALYEMGEPYETGAPSL